MTGFTVTASDVAAFLALVVAIWSAFQTGRFNRRQNDFAETAERLNQLLIAKEAAETEQQRQADLGANFVKLGKSNYRLKVFNRGAGAARNVRLEMLVGSELIAGRELAEKFPVPLLERQQGTELICFISMSAPRRAHIKLTWDDDIAIDRSKELWADVF
ncbi:hypothetical protein [Sphingomonas sp.]|uniref:hypothetical protein n=1 Tax=Sphingomonas sp. TaxID=28214 RepID=UPI003D6CFF43